MRERREEIEADKDHEQWMHLLRITEPDPDTYQQSTAANGSDVKKVRVVMFSHTVVFL